MTNQFNRWGQDIIEEDITLKEQESGESFNDADRKEVKNLNTLIQKASKEVQTVLVKSLIKKFDKKERAGVTACINKYTDTFAPKRKEFRAFCALPENMSTEVFPFLDNAMLLNIHTERGNTASFLELFHQTVQYHVTLESPGCTKFLSNRLRREIEKAHKKFVEKGLLQPLKYGNNNNNGNTTKETTSEGGMFNDVMQFADQLMGNYSETKEAVLQESAETAATVTNPNPFGPLAMLSKINKRKCVPEQQPTVRKLRVRISAVECNQKQMYTHVFI